MLANPKPVKKATRIQAANQARILEAGLEIFSTHGFKGATLDQIAEQAAMSKPNLLYYFKSKDDIYRAVLQRVLDIWLEPLTELDPRGDPVQEIDAYIRRKVELSRTAPKASRLFANEVLQGAPRIGAVLRGPLKVLVDQKAALIRRWMAERRLASIDPYHLIFAIWATTQHYADFAVQVRAVMGDQVDDQDHFKQTADAVAKLFLDGLRIR